ncbi:UNVERIFIED_CONTAM: Helicase-like transcription factor CHR28 [Sesamum calycinum]|uniref:Helicase-like transcription factor CHR28 n=1 Tax=Sesamum calycinum TaxID=2727403 RepID=A0AAW2MBJ2_9LAMI
MSILQELNDILVCSGTLIDGEPIINLPPKTIELKKVDFSKEERDFYCRLEAESRAQFAQRKRKMVSSAFGEDETGSRQTRLTVEDLKYLFRVD